MATLQYPPGGFRNKSSKNVCRHTCRNCKTRKDAYTQNSPKNEHYCPKCWLAYQNQKGTYLFKENSAI